MYRIIFACNLAVSQSTPAQPQGRIVGSVVNDANEPIAGARLCTTVVRPQVANTTCGGEKADDQGQFDITVPLQVNGISAQNSQLGYPAVDRPMEEGVRIKLSEKEPVAHVTIKIGPRPAELILSVNNETTGKPVGSYTVSWIRIDDGPVQQTNLTNKDRVLIPPNVDILVMVRAPGYQRWFYTDPATPSRPTLRLISGEQRSISGQLQPQ